MDVYSDVKAFYAGYRGQKRVIGKSREGRAIFALRAGTHAPPCGVAVYAMHAREWITAYLALEHVRRGTASGGVWIVPLADPDGALLVQRGISSVAAPRRGFLLRVNGGNDFSLWKANAAAVDLNVNWDAKWGTGVRNVYHPAPESYVGEAPFSEPETRAVRDFTLEVSPAFALAYHTKGEVVYWRFHQPPLRARRDKRLARVLSRVTGYPLAEAMGSAGGYKDWCVQTLGIPAFTVEAGRETFAHPLGFSALPDILKKNLDALAALTREF